MTDVTEQLQETVADAVEVVSEQAETFATATRALNRAKIQFTALGYVLGAATGALIAYKVAYVKAQTKFSTIADEEIEEMRRHYQEKAVALEATVGKADLDEIVQERGYVSNDDEKPPMAVTPPPKVVEAASEISEETTRVPPPVPADPAPDVENHNVFKDAPNTAAIMDSWDDTKERRLRSPDIPYVVHIDETHDFEGYTPMTLTYYDGDDVLSNERDEVIGKGIERETLVGEKNLNRFGHGSNDPNVVYVRNDKLELILEIVKSPNFYAEEVHGFAHTDIDFSNLERMRLRERDSLDDE